MTPSAYDQWLALYEASPARDAAFSTMSGVPLGPVYGPPDAEYPGLGPDVWTVDFSGWPVFCESILLSTARRFSSLITRSILSGS